MYKDFMTEESGWSPGRSVGWVGIMQHARGYHLLRVMRRVRTTVQLYMHKKEGLVGRDWTGRE